MWRRDAHLPKKNVRQLLVVVLAGVDQNGLDLRVAAHFAHQRANLREIGARAYDIEDFELLGHGASRKSLDGDYNIAVNVTWQPRIAVRA